MGPAPLLAGGLYGLQAETRWLGLAYAIGVDVGTTNTKAVLCELPSCKPIAIKRMRSPKIVQGERTDYDNRALIDGIMRMLSECTDELGEGAADVRFVSVASVGESGAFVYPDGSFSARSIFWYDRRGEEYAQEAIASGLSESLYRITGIPTHSNSALFKILWMRDNGEPIADATWLTMADFVAWALCGKLGQDRTLASRSAAYDISNDEVSGEILGHYGLPGHLFAPLVESGAARGRVLPEVARRTGLPSGCDVCVSGHDHMSGAVACDVKADSEALNSTGTSEGLLFLRDRPELSDSAMSRQITNGRYVDGALFTRYSSVPAAGLSYEWTLRTLGIEPDTYYAQNLNGLYEEYLEGRFDDSRLVFVPHLRGSGPPHRDSGARAFVYGMRDTTTREELIFATHAGTTAEFARLCDCMTDGKGLDDGITVKVIGPAAHNPLWMQMKADLLGVPFVACEVPEAVARGSVIVSARKAGIDVDVSFETKEYRPDEGRHAKAQEAFVSSYLPLSDAIERFESGD